MAKSQTGRSRYIDGKKHVEILMKIQTRYENGCPEDLTLLPDDQLVEISGGEEFLTVWMLEKMVKQ